MSLLYPSSGLSVSWQHSGQAFSLLRTGVNILPPLCPQCCRLTVIFKSRPPTQIWLYSYFSMLRGRTLILIGNMQQRFFWAPYSVSPDSTIAYGLRCTEFTPCPPDAWRASLLVHRPRMFIAETWEAVAAVWWTYHVPRDAAIHLIRFVVNPTKTVSNSSGCSFS